MRQKMTNDLFRANKELLKNDYYYCAKEETDDNPLDYYQPEADRLNKPMIISKFILGYELGKSVIAPVLNYSSNYIKGTNVQTFGTYIYNGAIDATAALVKMGFFAFNYYSLPKSFGGINITPVSKLPLAIVSTDAVFNTISAIIHKNLEPVYNMFSVKYISDLVLSSSVTYLLSTNAITSTLIATDENTKNINFASDVTLEHIGKFASESSQYASFAAFPLGVLLGSSDSISNFIQATTDTICHSKEISGVSNDLSKALLGESLTEYFGNLICGNHIE